MVSGNIEEAKKLAEDFGWLKQIDGKLSKNRERIEFEDKLAFLCMVKPWE